MKNSISRLFSKIVSSVLILSLVFTVSTATIYAEGLPKFNADDPFIVVSMGDSYSSGEGLPPFYGQEKDFQEKIKDEDWLAHRSQNSWPGQLEFSALKEGTTLKDYWSNNRNVAKWSFAAVSGAETTHFSNRYQLKTARWKSESGVVENRSTFMPLQMDAINKWNYGPFIDYVTLTIGGNDAGFADIIINAASHSAYLGTSLSDQLDSAWNEIDSIMGNIKEVYRDIAHSAVNATIIVAGYPILLDSSPASQMPLFSKAEAKLINDKVHDFNVEIQRAVTSCRQKGFDIHFVDVESEFNKDGGHGAYSKSPWINGVKLKGKQDIDQTNPISAYSFHPNSRGAKAYARCVNAKIKEIEAREESKGKLSGRVCEARDHTTPISQAKITVCQDGTTLKTLISDEQGMYSASLPVGEYTIKISADGYMSFVYMGAEINKQENTYLETFLMIQETEANTGTASGKISNAVTGQGIGDVSLTIRENWNNTTGPAVLHSLTDPAFETAGNYSLTLPIGNYTVCAEKDGYISTSFNIVVQEGETDSQNGVLSPMGIGDTYRIVLSWGENPRDLDSHMVGKLSTGEAFHVYFAQDYQYDGDVEICNLDVDDTSSYGPETITLNPTNAEPYYYYIYKYAGEGTVGNSAAQIKVYKGENLLRTFNVPTDQGSGDYWNVFAISNGELVIRNEIASEPSLFYAENP